MRFIEENNLQRKLHLPVRGKLLQLPIYFPSISSVKTRLSPIEYLNILKALGQPHFLVSAYDIDKSPHRQKFIKKLQDNLGNDGPIILMDSGNYESWWIRDQTWQIENFNEILSCDLSDVAFCFDNQRPPDDFNENATSVAKSTRISQSITKTTSVIPIIHCKTENLVNAVLELYNQTCFSMVAVPERILGDGMLERIRTVTNLRRELNKLDNYTYIHLLGTGNPLSLLLLSLAGADSFDGLEWCQTVVNSITATLYHFQQRELLLDSCDFCNSDLDYTLATLGHNLIFYNKWMREIQTAFVEKKEIDLLKKWIDPEVIKVLEKIWN